MLCKTSVARRVLSFAWQQALRVTSAAQFQIDAASSFNAAVDACLLVCRLQEGPVSSTCSVYSDLSASAAEHVVGWRDRQLVAEVDAYERRRALRAVTGPRWRSGIKHDCSRVMEFTRQGTLFVNGLNEAVSLEEECLYPLLKSSDLTRSDATPPRKWVLVTQRSVGEDTCRLRRTAPHTWEYLCSHRDRLDRRASSIYNGRPPFSIFGVGDYSFAPWKVAVSGLYKRLAFRKVGPWNGRPAMLDDTAYFLPCTNEQLADLLLALLRSQPAQEFLQSLIFWDSKRPITVEVLRQIDLAALAQELGLSREQQARIAGLLETGSEDAVSERQRSLFA
jgi:hypothetical protein